MRARRLTRNRMGWASERLSPLSEEFVEFCRSGACGPASPALEIGAAFGAAVVAALEAGATVIANDLEPEHLLELERRVAEPLRARLVCRPGRFPQDLHMEDGALGAVHASNVLHFLTGNELARGLRAIARWLRPGGRVFVQAASPFQQPFAAFIPEFERRIEIAEKWPGWVEKISRYCSHRQLGQMPRSMHFLDDRLLTRYLTDSGLRVERAWLYSRPDLPGSLLLDGRETAAAIAVKPLIIPSAER
jgi:SAM-dependent methyltransferase